MIYDPITRQSVTLLGRYSKQKHCYRFGKKEVGDFQFIKVRYGEHISGFSGGFTEGTERDVDVNSLVADDGILEISRAVETLPLIEG